MRALQALRDAATSGAPKTLIVRKPVNDVVCCTNHFRSEELGKPTKCWRFDALDPLHTQSAKLGVSEVFGRLDAVNQGKFTLQSMVFEPAVRKWHLKVGSEPASKLAGLPPWDICEEKNRRKGRETWQAQ